MPTPSPEPETAEGVGDMLFKPLFNPPWLIIANAAEGEVEEIASQGGDPANIEYGARTEAPHSTIGFDPQITRLKGMSFPGRMKEKSKVETGDMT